MAPVEERTSDQVRRELLREREQLTRAVGSLRNEARLGPRLPVLAAGALGTGFVLAGGIGATVRLLFRRGRER